MRADPKAKKVGRGAIAGALVALVALGLQGGGCGRSDDVLAGAGGATTAATVGGSGGGGGYVPPDFEPCAEVHEEATLVPVNMFLTVDKSGSMGDVPMGAMVSKWESAVAALKAFFADPSAANLGLALRLWPLATDGCNEMACDAMACSQPQVPLGLLGDMAHQQALGGALDAVQPGDSTPMSAALDGARLFGEAQLTAEPDEEVVIVMVTDGEPQACDTDVANIAAIAGQAAAAGIPVYVVGIEGVSTMTIDQIAQQGGTTAGYYIGGANGEAELLAAMQDIQGKAVNCSFPYPEEDPSKPLAPELMKLEYTSGSDTIVIPKVAGPADCGADGGWYLDDENDPTTITLCPETCDTVQADTSAQVDVAVGCECERDEDCPVGNVCEDHMCVPPCMTDADCPPDHICHEGHCIPAPGDPCVDDTGCPAPLFCLGGQCQLEGGIIVGPEEAVQGGAFTCGLAQPARSSPWPAWLACAGAALALALRRRS